MSTPVPSPSMNGMIGSSGTRSTPSARVIFSGVMSGSYRGASACFLLRTAASAGERDHQQRDEVDGQQTRGRAPDRAAVERSRPPGHAGEVVAALAAAHRVGGDGRPAQRARRRRRRGGVELCAQVVLPRLAPAQRDDRRSAASTVLLRSMARVVGPTPPRRGVIHDATSATDSSTSGITRRPSYVAPALTTAAPGLTMSGVTMPALPAATTRMSAVRVYSPRSPTPVWTTV